MEIVCPTCGCSANKSIGSINRAKRLGRNVFCSKKCAGIARRKNIFPEQKKADKAEYDKKYRAKNLETIKKRKSEYFKKTYDPEKAKVIRKERMPRHVAYCRTPEYKAKKKNYDLKHRAQQNYGEFWESELLIREIRKEYDNTTVKQSNNLLNKNQKRKREWKTQQTLSLQRPH